MDTIVTARPPQTLYVTIRRDELRQLKDERDTLKTQVAQLRQLLQQQAQLSGQPMPSLSA
ncbi:DUF6026 family protein [Pseudomonas frederiksbergensis]|jgi:cell division protein FtsB|uniref:Uncharacterized protein n=2 Tax=Pseudomonas TaxID=286 RepID=A0A423K8F9_9PSED|nr:MULTISPECIES: DUF6026 family protein [Pseudomonas]KAF2394989.1 hypothetical protein FX983_02972 [Pseudomonas frederiksbergensis]KPN90775.1 hypothetical protein AL066_10695 [Pseudomonas nunensis]MCL5226603.1 DUF6026 family protein [Pseudomonas nunensis]MDN3224425.1 DUF6026 family protein [Pseudomonas nunensis]RON48073.1 hypothetical protein BK666_10400 [Pseudomonas frederiksbergensis]